MKILIYNWRDINNPEAGGAEVFTHEIAKRLVDYGHNITWFTAKFPGCKKEEIIDRINIIRDGNRFTVYWKAREYYDKYFKGNFDIIIDEINTIPFMTPKFINGGEKIIVLIHQLAREFWFFETPLPVALIGRYLLEDYLLRMYKNIPTLTVSNSTKKDLLEIGFRNISIIPEGIKFKALEKVGKKEEDPTFIFVGRLKKAKKPHDAIKAFNMAKKEMIMEGKWKNAKLWIVGDGYCRNSLEKLAGTDVKFFGKIEDNKKLELMSRAWAILVPGVREGWGLVVTEANAMGTPAIGYDVPGLKDAINSEGGILVNGYEEMAKKMKILDWNLLSEKALENSRLFSWDISAKIVTDRLKNILNGDDLHDN